MKLDYTPQYYSRLSSGAGRSANVIVPLVLDLVHPESIVDLGCGTGAWLAEFQRRGVSDILGVDGSHIAADQLAIDASLFVAADLNQPLRLERTFDLALSLEVAEHLAEQQADKFVDTLTCLAPVVLFSAAIPYQGGEHHLNEQWPAYWAERFAARDFVALDAFRRVLWDRPDVEWWYAQNMVLYVRRDRVPEMPQVATIRERGIPNCVHPRNYLDHAWQNRVLRVAVDLAAATRTGDGIVLADEDRFGPFDLPGRTIRPVIERNGSYYGPPRDGKEAVAELKRMQREGATYFAIGWPAFWWLEHYPELNAYLASCYDTVLRNEQVILYRVRS